MVRPWVSAVIAFGTLAAPASADRKPSKQEASAIERVALKACPPVLNCDVKKVRVSTRSARYAWADVIGEGLSGVLVRRPTTQSRRFKIVGTQGGGISECSYWRARAPKSVLRDLHVKGLVGSAGEVRTCG